MVDAHLSRVAGNRLALDVLDASARLIFAHHATTNGLHFATHGYGPLFRAHTANREGPKTVALNPCQDGTYGMSSLAK
jgi:hypothetical protein